MARKQRCLQRARNSKSPNRKISDGEQVLKTQRANKIDIQSAKALIKLELEQKEKEHEREIAKRKFLFEICRESVITVFVIFVIAILLMYVGQRIADTNASEDEKRLAFGICGIAIGAATEYLFGKRGMTEK